MKTVIVKLGRSLAWLTPRGLGLAGLLAAAWGLALFLAPVHAQQSSTSGQPQPPLGRGSRFSGEWELVGRPNDRQLMVLDQRGERVSGQYQYDKGAARIKGRVEGDFLRLQLIYEDQALLVKWLAAKVAQQVVGIKSALDLRWNPALKRLEGTHFPFYVDWDKNLNVTKVVDGGTETAAKFVDAFEVAFVRTGGWGRSVPQPSAGLKTGFLIEAEEELDSGLLRPGEAQVLGDLPHSGRGYWRLTSAGDWLVYSFEPPQAGLNYIWLREYFGGRPRPARERTLEVLVDCREIEPATIRETPRDHNWAWRMVGQVRLNLGKHLLVLRKRAASPDPDLIDALWLSPDPEAWPPRL
ncbi:MAG: hypothetical protein JRJ59_12525 [Deltaproteobacteria bacterium]|nr:hypothetical protein [Deltaproteobacteria bacterium]